MRPPQRKIYDEHATFMEALVARNLIIDANTLDVREFYTEEDGSTFLTTELTWAGSNGLSYLFSEYSTIEQYVEAVRRRDFTWLLSDGSLIQIYYKFARDELRSHRLCFHPCPFSYSGAEFGDLGISEIPEMLGTDELLKSIRLATPIRFDFDSKFTDEKHAHSHLTINKNTCRMPAFGPVSLGHFLKFVFRYFYESDFEVEGWWPDVHPRIFSKTLNYPRPHEFIIDSSSGFE